MQIVLALLLILGTAFAQTDFMVAVPGVAIVVGIFLAAMVMFSNMFANPQMLAWTKSEYREFVAAIILIVIIYAIFISPVGLKPLTQAITGEENYIDASVGVIDNMLYNETSGYDTAYKYIIRAATKVRIGATYSPWLTIPVWIFSLMYSSSPLAGVSIMLIGLGQATQGLTNVIYLYEALRLLIIFSHATVPTIILPLAFALRIIPFTRRMGNTLIAVSLAAIVLLPLSVIIAGEMNNLIDYPYVVIDDIDDLDAHPWAMELGSIFCGLKPIRFIFSLTDYGFAALICLPLLLIPIIGVGLFVACYTLVSEVVYPIIMLVVKLAQLILLVIWLAWSEISVGTKGGFGSYGWPGEVFYILLEFLEQVNNVILVGYIDIVLIAIITISGAKAISTALGGEWYLAGVERLI